MQAWYAAAAGFGARFQVEVAVEDQDILVVISKVKNYIRSRSGMNTSGGVAQAVSEHVRHLCDQAIESARKDGRKTVMDRDLPRSDDGPAAGQA